jgi:hypothetical protein
MLQDLTFRLYVILNHICGKHRIRYKKNILWYQRRHSEVTFAFLKKHFKIDDK